MNGDKYKIKSFIIDYFHLGSQFHPKLRFYLPIIIVLGLVIDITLISIYSLFDIKTYDNFSIFFLEFPLRFFIDLCIMTPILETILGQLLFIEVLRYFKSPKWFMISISSIFFSVLHISRGWFFIIIALPMAVLLAYNYLRFRSFSFYKSYGTTALIHGIHNTVAYILIALSFTFVSRDMYSNPLSAKKVLEEMEIGTSDKDFIDYVKYGYVNTVKLCLVSGVNPDTTDSDGNTVLMYAVWNNRIDIVESLIRAGADIHKFGKSGVTALFLARQEGHTEIEKMLIDAGAKY